MKVSLIWTPAGEYDPSLNNWKATQTNSAPEGRSRHTAVWTGSEMIIWGGFIWDLDGTLLNTGGRYNPSTNSWTVTNNTNPPKEREFHSVVWTGNEMIVWGGYDNHNFIVLNTGGKYDPSTDTWTATSITNAPAARDYHTAIWTGREMIVWGGSDRNDTLNTGTRYCAQSQPPVALSAVSRKTHGAAGSFDVPLPLTGNVGIECRTGGTTNDYQVIIEFANPVTVGSASVTSGAGSVNSFIASGAQVAVNLTGVTNGQRITVTLSNVNDGSHLGDVPVSMGVLVGDVNGNAAVTATDVSLTRVGRPLDGSNFRQDVTANGSINATDVALVKAMSGTALP